MLGSDGDRDKAEEVLDDIIEKFPNFTDSSSNKNNTKTRIHNVKLSTYLESKGTTVSDTCRGMARYLDRIQFFL